MAIKFHTEGNDHCWFSDNNVWGIIKKYSDDKFLLYREGTDQFFIFTGLQFDNFYDIEIYVNQQYKGDSMDQQARKGSLAICGIGTLGLITHDEPLSVTYGDGNKGVAYVGIHLTNKVCPVGSAWSSRNPKVIGYIEYENLDDVLKLFT